MLCANCNKDNPADASFCEDCGAKLELICPACKASVSPGARFCKKCGTAIGSVKADASAIVSSTKSQIRFAADGSASEAIEGERKTVTALFADIKGSTELEQDLDPEEARAIIDPALKLMIDAVHRYDGYIVQSTGDGIFALFGAPVAHEDHPQRALYAALRMQEELKRYSAGLREGGKLPIEARVGVNTGEVVVRSITTGEGHTEYTPIGHTTNLASRMQALAPTGSIAASEQTRKFCEGYFTLKPLGPTKVKGVSEPVNVYEVTGLGPLRTRLQRSAGRGFTKFVGRQREMDAMKAAAEQAKAGRGQIVAAMAEAGVGKSRLMFEFKATSAAGWMVLEAFSVSHGKASSYLPVIDLLHSYFGIDSADDARKRREKVGGKVLMLDRALEEAIPYLLSLLGIVDGDDPLAQMEGQVKRRRTLDAIKRILLRESLNQPLMVIFEDLHWVDEGTQGFLNLLADSIGTAKILLLINYRPEYSHRWNSKTYYTRLRLDPLGEESADEMLSALLGDGAELAPLKRLIIEKTEGNPFFMEETVEVLLDEGALVRNGSIKLVKPLAELKIPPTVQDILASRIDRLPPAEKDLLQTLAVIGREFAFVLLQRMVTKSEDELDRMLHDLQLAEFIYEQPAVGGVEYTFKHALTQEVAYGSMLQERRRALHEHVAAAIEEISGPRLEDRYSELARHYRQSGNVAKAIEYLRLSGEQAIQRSASPEAIVNLTAAVALIQTLPASVGRDHKELDIQTALGSALTAQSVGLPEKERALERARELSTRTGGNAKAVPILFHLAEGYISHGRLHAACELAAECLLLTDRLGEPNLQIGAHHSMGEALFFRGEFTEARRHLEKALALYDASQHQTLTLLYGMDPSTLSGGILSMTLCVLGEIGKSLDMARVVLARAREQSHSYSLAFGLMLCAMPRWFVRDSRSALELADAAIAISTEHGFDEVRIFCEGLAGWTLLDQGRFKEGMAKQQIFLDAIGGIGGCPGITQIRAELAIAYGRTGKFREAEAELQLGFDWMRQTDERCFEAELHRIRGELQTMARHDEAESERCFRAAIEIASRQSAKLWELRATTSLARLLDKQGHRDEARPILAEIYGWFAEGFDTADLKDAKALLDELSG
jgi:class 3 adenylate cyclase/tetratricopeptide (TPR) repeat protein